MLDEELRLKQELIDLQLELTEQAMGYLQETGCEKLGDALRDILKLWPERREEIEMFSKAMDLLYSTAA